ARVAELEREIERDLAPDHELLAAPGDDVARGVDELGRQHDARRDVGREGVTNPRALHAEPGHCQVALAGAAGRDREARAHHLRVVDAAPEVAAVGHVAVLALDALAREAIRLPLVVRVLEELAAEREAVPAEL